MTGHVAKLRDKAKLILATMSAITATTMAVVTFMSGGGVDDLSAADGIKWDGPVGLLDSDYAHLTTVGQIGRARRQDEYTATEIRDPMVALIDVTSGGNGGSNDDEDKAPPPPTFPNMWFSGTIMDAETPIAIIDGRDLRVGDLIKGARVLEIRMDSVVLSFASKEYTLTID
jgi:hypothetical protein